MRPVIGLTLDFEANGGSYSMMPWYAIRQNYCDAVYNAGGLPILLPHYQADIRQYADTLDGLIITGGDFDIDPHLYGEDQVHSTVNTKENRTNFEWALAQLFLHNKKPILGICGGQQLLAVLLGGKLIQHIPDVTNTINHEQKTPRTQAGHEVNIVKSTLLAKIVQTDRMAVNSAHHQAVKSVPDNIIINAVAPDGIIEGIEDPLHPFCLGVQWHPEYTVDKKDFSIFQSFVAAC